MISKSLYVTCGLVQFYSCLLWAIIGGYWLDTSNNWQWSALNFEATCSKAFEPTKLLDLLLETSWFQLANQLWTEYFGLSSPTVMSPILDGLIKCNSLSCQNKTATQHWNQIDLNHSFSNREG
jgi:hypothetical protein